VNNEPKILNLLDMLKYYLLHQEDVVTRRTKYDLNKAREQAHIKEALLRALDFIDEIIRIIRSSKQTQEAKQRLMDRFDFDDVQAQAIVDMRLRQLTGLEREKLQADYDALMAQISEFVAILSDEKKLLSVIKTEISVISDKYGDDRRTSIGFDEFDISMEDLIPDDPTVIARTKLGYIKRMSLEQFRTQNRGGKGIKGMQTIQDDFIEDLFMTTNHHYLLFFTNTGRVYRMKSYESPEASRTARGTAIVNLLQLTGGEKITAVIALKEFGDDRFLFMATRKGIVKKTRMQAYANIRKTGIQGMALREDDELISVKATDNKKDILLVSKMGQCIRFNEKDVRGTGRNSMGVYGMRLAEGDAVVSMLITDEAETALFLSEFGLGKRTDTSEFAVQHRGGKGVRCYKINERSGNLVGALMVNDDDEIIMITNEGILIRIPVGNINKIGRNTTGVICMNVDSTKDIRVASFAIVQDNEEESETAIEEMERKLLSENDEVDADEGEELEDYDEEAEDIEAEEDKEE
ncbi:MAG: DNA gyrase subunit A, partial [Lachnospiraceae bacterium]|nr:DNA gyrase subunit A [Lachnospiraceae bacterium]